VIPHVIVLVFLWIAFALATVVAFFAVLFTGRYPRGLFDFNVGVLRWSWRVGFYSYSALATDRYPPLTLADVPDYPARLHVEYPQELSRGLVLVKWWLLALPHYLIVGVFAGGAWAGSNAASDDWAWASFGGLIGLLVLIAGVVLLVTGPLPQGDLRLRHGHEPLGLPRRRLRALMTDAYPPFRLDMGGHEPAPGTAGATSSRPSRPRGSRDRLEGLRHRGVRQARQVHGPARAGSRARGRRGVP
jgi:hypothetical protein